MLRKLRLCQKNGFLIKRRVFILVIFKWIIDNSHELGFGTIAIPNLF